MKKTLLAATMLLSLAAGAACAQPAGGLGTSTGPSGGIVGSGTLSTPTGGSGIIGNSPGTGNSGLPYSPSSGNIPATPSGPLGAMPSQLPNTSPGTPNQSPSGSVPGANSGVPGVNQP
jgi:hypothetical protein